MSDNIFNAGMGGIDPVVNVDEKKDAAKLAAKKAKLDEMKASLRSAISEDPSLIDRMHTLSGSLEVTNSLGFGDNGNIIVTSKTESGERVLGQTSYIVGYRVRNNGDVPVKYTTEEYIKDETGEFVGHKVEKTLAPGGVVDLPRQYMTMLCARPEVSFQVANGKIVRGSGAQKSGGTVDIKAELEAYYFTFSKDDGRNINSDEVKLNVGMKAGDKWVVKPEFEATFGYLNNEREKKAPNKRAKGDTFSSSDLAAHYVMQMMEKAQL